jgi:drug/metabolite transporter (DMT)-like permease
MESTAGLPRLGYLLLAVLTLGWGVNWVFIKTALFEIPLWQYRAVTVAIAGGATLTLAHFKGERLAVPRGQWLALTAASLFNVAIWHVLTAYGILVMATGQVALIAFTMPVWAAIMGVFFLREALTTRHILALVLGIGGIAVLLSRDLAAIGASPMGGVLGLLAAVSWAAGTVIVKRVAWTIPILTLVGWQLVISFVPLAAFALAIEPITIHTASATAFGAMAYTIFIATVFCYYAWFKLVSIFPANVASVGTLLTPAVSLLAGAAVFAEPLGWRELAAVLLVLSAVALVLLRRTPAPAPA